MIIWFNMKKVLAMDRFNALRMKFFTKKYRSIEEKNWHGHWERLNKAIPKTWDWLEQITTALNVMEPAGYCELIKSTIEVFKLDTEEQTVAIERKIV